MRFRTIGFLISLFWSKPAPVPPPILIRFHVAGGPELRLAVAAVAERLTAALGAERDRMRD